MIVYSVHFSEEDKQWVGTCNNYHSLSHLASNPTKALLGIIDLAEMARDDINEERLAILSEKVDQGITSGKSTEEIYRQALVDYHGTSDE